MPVYEYQCEQCGERIEQTETIAEHEAGKRRCPKCGGKTLTRVFSIFQVKTSRKS